MNPYKKVGNRWFILVGIWILINLIVHQPVQAEGNVWDAINQQEQQSSVQDEEESSLPTDQEENLFPANEGQNIFMLIIQIIFYLCLILAMIYGLIKFLAIRQKKLGHHQLFQTLGGISLGNNKSLQLVKIGGKLYLLGVADQVSLIKEIVDPLEVEAIQRDLDEQESIISKSFKSLLMTKLDASKTQGVQQPLEHQLHDSLATIKQKRAAFEEEWLKETNKEGSPRD